MTFKEETKKQRLARYMEIPAKKKLEWLRQMNDFFLRFSSKKTRRVRQKLREIRL